MGSLRLSFNVRKNGPMFRDQEGLQKLCLPQKIRKITKSSKILVQKSTYPIVKSYQRSITNSQSIWQEFAFNSAFSIQINLCGIFCGGLLTPTVWPKLVNLICQTILILSITNFLTLFGLRFVALFVWPNWLIYKWLLLRSVIMSFGLKSFGYSFFKIQNKDINRVSESVYFYFYFFI